MAPAKPAQEIHPIRFEATRLLVRPGTRRTVELGRAAR
jgi:hypothetical protein